MEALMDEVVNRWLVGWLRMGIMVDGGLFIGGVRGGGEKKVEVVVVVGGGETA